ncbi:MAG: hypothetical protein CML68_20410 [Rhodobacteraceae bacterium]|nr:hypothetical protein [Paracoccaceae bacterium]
MAAYTKTALIKDVAEQLGTTTATTTRVLDAILAQIIGKTQDGENVTLKGFGSFRMRESAARQGRNPHTGETMEIPASRRLAFKASKARS